MVCSHIYYENVKRNASLNWHTLEHTSSPPGLLELYKRLNTLDSYWRRDQEMNPNKNRSMASRSSMRLKWGSEFQRMKWGSWLSLHQKMANWYHCWDHTAIGEDIQKYWRMRLCSSWKWTNCSTVLKGYHQIANVCTMWLKWLEIKYWAQL